MDPTPIHNIGAVDRILLGMCSQPAMRRDEYIVDELTNHLFQTSSESISNKGQPVLDILLKNRYLNKPCFFFLSLDKPFGMDLMALNIQRARDHGIPPYLVWREACGLTPIRNWGQLLSIMDDDTVGRLRIAYNSLEDIDLFPGAMAEKPVVGGMVGPTFACIIAQQFLNLRQGIIHLWLIHLASYVSSTVVVVAMKQVTDFGTKMATYPTPSPTANYENCVVPVWHASFVTTWMTRKPSSHGLCSSPTLKRNDV